MAIRGDKGDEMSRTVLRSEGLSCPTCVAKIEKALEVVEGVERAEVWFASGKIEVEHDASRVTAEELAGVVRKLGYEARVSAY